jgi:GNAT superfamily N-acetyltransferase
MLDRRLLHHLVTWLGQWPAGQPFTVVGSTRRTEPGWDGRIHPAIGVGSPTGRVLSVSPGHTTVVRRLVGESANASSDGPLGPVLDGLPAAVGFPERRAFEAVFRWTLDPAPLPAAGEWLPADHPAVPDWLRPFGAHTPGTPAADSSRVEGEAARAADVLIARDPDTGAYLAGVGIKRHDQYGHEIAVGTEPAARGRGLARRLVAQAARRVLDEGAVPTYLHDPANIASCRVAESAGLPDRGWTAFGVAEAAG